MDIDGSTLVYIYILDTSHEAQMQTERVSARVAKIVDMLSVGAVVGFQIEPASASLGAQGTQIETASARGRQIEATRARQGAQSSQNEAARASQGAQGSARVAKIVDMLSVGLSLASRSGW